MTWYWALACWLAWMTAAWALIELMGEGRPEKSMWLWR